MILTILAITILAIAALFSLIAGIWFLVVAFKEHILWGLAVIFLPLAALIFLIMHWEEAKRPFLLNLLSIILIILGAVTFSKTQVAAPGATNSSSTTEFSIHTLTEKINMPSFEKTENRDPPARGYIGMSLTEIQQHLGPPNGILQKDNGTTTYLYDDLTLLSTNGTTITDEIHK